MFSKFSVRKPFTIIVGIILVLVLGAVSLSKMTTDLLPSMNLPYAIVSTTLPGAPPEEVEQTLTVPVEKSLASVSNLDTIRSVSQENVSLVIMQFTDDTDMDSVSLEMRESLDMLKNSLPENAGSPMIMKMNPNMLPVMMLSADMKDKTQAEISAFAKEHIIPAIDGVPGVAAAEGMGLVESWQIVNLKEKKIDKLNAKVNKEIEAKINGEAKEPLLEGKSQIEDGLKKAKAGRKQAAAGLKKIQTEKPKLLEAKKALEAAKEQYGALPPEQEAQLKQINDGLAKMDEKSVKKSIKQVDKTIAELEEKLKEVNDGLAKVDEQIQKTRDSGPLDNLLTKDMISKILMGGNFSFPAGYVSEDGMDYLVRVGDKFSDAEDMENLLLTELSEFDIPVRLSDVADIETANNGDDIFNYINGNYGVILNLQKQTEYATTDVTHAVAEKIEQLEKQYEDLNITVLMDQGEYVDQTMGSVGWNLLIGAILAILVLLLFLRDFRPTLMVALSIPFSLLLAILLMYFSGVTLNIISMGGLALGVGMLVDNSIVVIENIYRMRSEGMDSRKAAIKGAQQVAGAIIASTLTTIVVFVPIVFTSGITKQLFVDMGLTIGFSLIASLIIALTFVPMAASGLLKKEANTNHPLFQKFTNAYEKILRGALRVKWIPIVLIVLLFAGSIAGLVTRGREFFPEAESTELSVNLEFNKDNTYEKTVAELEEAADELSKVKGIDTIGVTVSKETDASSGVIGMMMSAGSGANSTTVYVILDEDNERPFDDVKKDIETKCENLGIDAEVQTQGSNMAMLAGDGITVDFKGADLDKLKDLTLSGSDIIAKVPGVEEVTNDFTNDPAKEVKITVSKDKAAKKGASVAQVYQAVQDLLKEDEAATNLMIDADKVDIFVEDESENAVTKSDILNLKIKGADGKKFKVKDVAKLSEEIGYASINRNNQERNTTATATLKEGYNITKVTEAVEAKLKSLEVPNGYEYTVGGENESITDALSQLMMMLLLALLFVYLVMVAQFQSLFYPLIIMSTMLLAITGGYLGLFATGLNLSVIALLGFVMLVGIVVNNGIVLVDYINKLRISGLDLTEAVVLAGKTRLRPIIMTSLTTIVAMFTMAIGFGEGTEMMQPLAVTVIGGLIYATVLTLIFVPVLYTVFSRKNSKRFERERLANLEDEAAEAAADASRIAKQFELDTLTHTEIEHDIKGE